MKVGSKTVKIGIAKIKFSLRFLKNWNKSRVFHMTNAAITNSVNSRAMFTEPSMAMKVKPNSLGDKGHSNCSCPPIKKSAIREWETKAAK